MYLMPSPRRKHHVEAFTLVELLVVIGIIALLVSILLPALTKARVQAQRVQCLSQLREISNQILLYAHNHHNYLPASTFYPPPTNPNNLVRWLTVLQAQGMPSKITICPAHQDYRPTDPINRFGHYGANPHLMRKWIPSTTSLLRLSSVRQSSQKILIGDAGGWIFSDYVIDGPHGGWWYVPGTRPDVSPAAIVIDAPLHNDFVAGRHSRGVNLAWADGHASWVLSKELGEMVVFQNNYSWWVSKDSSARDLTYAW